ncbi:MAG: hypothetical protein JO056_03515 [Alphaproteobacteria bacterium]|nr:hypothetical protein [Alphaproteobacteria bacterium]
MQSVNEDAGHAVPAGRLEKPHYCIDANLVTAHLVTACGDSYSIAKCSLLASLATAPASLCPCEGYVQRRDLRWLDGMTGDGAGR